MIEAYEQFNNRYNNNNLSKISLLFYGTYMNTATCMKCKNKIFNFQKFELISFGAYKYHKKIFNIIEGFREISKPDLLTGDNSLYCNKCYGLQNGEIKCEIIEPPNKLIIIIDYGKKK